MLFLEYSQTWNEAINSMIDIFMKCADWMWSLTLPATDIPLYTIWITAGIIKLMLLIIGSNPKFSTLSSNASSASSKAVKGATGKMSKNDNNSGGSKEE